MNWCRIRKGAHSKNTRDDKQKTGTTTWKGGAKAVNGREGDTNAAKERGLSDHPAGAVRAQWRDKWREGSALRAGLKLKKGKKR